MMKNKKKEKNREQMEANKDRNYAESEKKKEEKNTRTIYITKHNRQLKSFQLKTHSFVAELDKENISFQEFHDFDSLS